MAPRQPTPNAVRRTPRSLYVVTGLYVGIGLLLAVPAALSGDRLSTIFGLLIIGSALGATVVLRLAHRVEARITTSGECLVDLRHRMQRFEQAINKIGIADSEEPPTRGIDLAAIGCGDPSVLAAATLDRSAFPRLVHVMEQDALADAAETPQDEEHGTPLPGDSLQTAHATDSVHGVDGTDVTTKNLLREWKVGLRNGDLTICRAVFSTLVDTLEPALVERFKAQLDDLADRTEMSLRKLFSERARQRDCQGMLAIGEQICKILPGQPIAEEFRRIKPHLLQRLQRNSEENDVPSFLVVQ